MYWIYLGCSFDKVTKVLNDSYLLPENDKCENGWWWWVIFIWRKFWNNKILLLTIFVIDQILLAFFKSREYIDDGWYSFHGIIAVIILGNLYNETDTNNPFYYSIFQYGFEEIKNYFNDNTGSENAT